MTLRHRLLCTIQTEHEVKTTFAELCPVSPSHDQAARFDLGKLRMPDHTECVPSMLVSDIECLVQEYLILYLTVECHLYCSII